MEEKNTEKKKGPGLLKFNPYTIKAKMFLGFSLAALMFLLFIIITVSRLSGFVNTENTTVRNYQHSVIYSYALMNGINQSMSLLKENIYHENDNLKEELENVWGVQVAKNLDSLEKKALTLAIPEFTAQFEDIKGLEKKLRTKVFEAARLPYQPPVTDDPLDALPDSIRSLVSGYTISTDNIIYHHTSLNNHLEEEVSPVLNDLLLATNNYITTIESSVEGLRAEVDDELATFIIIEAIMFIALLSFLIVAALFIIKRILNNINRLKSYMNTLSKGDLPDRISETKDELNEVIIPLKSLISNLKNIRLFAQHVGRKDFDNEIKVFNDNGELGSSLAEMRSSLKKVSEEDKVRYWTNEGLARFGEILRKNTDNLSEISGNIITNLVKYLNANQGGIFIYNDEVEEDKHLELKACYAFNRKKYLEKKIYPGQGLVGQCFLEEEYIYLTKVPEEYVDITSGLGDANPRSILIVPLKVNEQVFGIIELASFQEFDGHQIDFVLKISESIANAISSVKVNEKTQALLEHSQQMTEQLRSQEEEMRQNMEELQATQEEVERKGRELVDFNTSIDQSTMIIAFDPEGTIIQVNDKFCNITQYTSHDLVGKPESAIMPNDFLVSGEYDERWEKLKVENYLECDGKRLKKDGSLMWMRAYYFPIKDEKQRVKKISCICSDITEEKKMLEELQKTQKEMHAKQLQIEQAEANLKSLINNTTDSIMALDKNYKPIIVNDTYKERYKNAGLKLEEAESVLDVLGPEIREEWKGYYDRALSGENYSIIIESGQQHREYFFNPIKGSNGEISGISIFSKDITDRVKETTKNKERIQKHQKTIERLKSKLGMPEN